ncbi:putative sporulation protein YyaC [Bacillus sp. OV166]|jgi:putative sporulation protein YyaC|uniref:Spore protease YyaC n=1 Tax=Priestia megaterium TaxID=1404 RepID=A0A6H1NXC8_PRIMG|nr:MULTISPECIES: spore protease YyaC [Bacillaceae]PGY07697.1 spore protease YyaC [Bacillus sp. AFS031507]QIZ05936.1 spore protease YyaC [Priestia megaterium]SMQ59185.1 putative sporulation protein YyaC [Bacillus sp. OV166]
MNLKTSFFDRRAKTRISHDDLHAAENLAEELLAVIPSLTKRPIVFVCIGTDRSTGDSLGPLVGTLLEEKGIRSFYVYGTLDEPIHAVNLSEKLKEIHAKHDDPYIIGIDACLGRIKNVGVIQLGNGPVKPGAGVNKELPAVGDIHITGIVNVSGFMEFFVLQNTRLNLVMRMAKTIANGIYQASLLYPKQTWTELNLNWLEEEKTN